MFPGRTSCSHMPPRYLRQIGTLRVPPALQYSMSSTYGLRLNRVVSDIEGSWSTCSFRPLQSNSVRKPKLIGTIAARGHLPIPMRGAASSATNGGIGWDSIGHAGQP